MEYDEYNRNEFPDQQPMENYRIPDKSKYYQVPPNLIGVEILPIRNIILNDQVKIIINRLKKSLKSSSYSSQQLNSQRLSNLDFGLRNLFNKFAEKKPMQPVIIRQLTVID